MADICGVKFKCEKSGGKLKVCDRQKGHSPAEAHCGDKDVVEEPVLALGAKVFIRTVTHYYTGIVVQVTEKWIELREAAWVADTGLFSEFLATGKVQEVEPYPTADSRVLVFTAGIIDVSPWLHDLPRKKK